MTTSPEIGPPLFCPRHWGHVWLGQGPKCPRLQTPTVVSGVPIAFSPLTLFANRSTTRQISAARRMRAWEAGHRGIGLGLTLPVTDAVAKRATGGGAYWPANRAGAGQASGQYVRCPIRQSTSCPLCSSCSAVCPKPAEPRFRRPMRVNVAKPRGRVASLPI